MAAVQYQRNQKKAQHRPEEVILAYLLGLCIRLSIAVVRNSSFFIRQKLY